MPKQKLTQSDFHDIGIYDVLFIKRFGRTGKKLIRSGKYTNAEVLDIFKQILEKPEGFLQSNEVFRPLAEFVQSTERLEQPAKREIVTEPEIQNLNPEPLYYKIFGREQIEQEAIDQMDTAMRLPISKAGALMPDAHVGYGLPIGGVLATKNNVVIPYAVGVDIACRMCMSVFDLPEKKIKSKSHKLKSALINNTIFGVGSEAEDHIKTGIFDKKEWQETKTIRDLKTLACRQSGTSGAGNHFVEWGILKVSKEDSLLNIPSGDYIALLSHSGSRGFGAKIADIYSDIARQQQSLPNQAKHLAWLDLDSEEGMEYWIAMNLAGEYASDNHHVIHKKISDDIGLQPIKMIENHHNFAWKEKLEDGTEVIVHRKGATPAGKDNIGIIPGSMTHPGYIIRGKADTTALNSASHGAGRILSRKKATKIISAKDLKIVTEKAGIELIGGHVDEAPKVYKNIDKVMSYQKNLVDVLAKFTPKIVRMAEPKKWRR